MKEMFIGVASSCLIVLFCLLLIYGAWSCKRRVNYNMSYKSMVGEQIQNNLKPVNARLNDFEMRLNDLQQRVK
jgi:hypothetical protein